MVKGDYKKAIDDLSLSLQFNSKNAETYYCRGLAYNIQGDKKKAIADFETALRLDPNNAEYKKNLEKARGARGR